MYFFTILGIILFKVQSNIISHKLVCQYQHAQIQNPLIDYYQVEYFIPLQVGSQNQTFEILIDTGSSDLWFPAKGAKGFKKLSEKQKFDCNSSDTCYETQKKLLIDYDDGPITGYVAWDQVCLQDCHYHINNQSFLLVNKAKDNVKNNPGIMGLSFQKLAQNKNPTLLTTMVNEGLIKHRVFSLYLTDVGIDGSEIIFGGFERKFMQNPNDSFIYAPLVSTSSYKIDLFGIKVGNKTIKTDQALVDSGTSCLTIPAGIIDRVLEQFQKNYTGLRYKYVQESYAPAYSMIHFKFNHTNITEILENLPNFEIRINEYDTLHLSPRDYIYKCKIKEEKNKIVCLSKLERSEQDYVVILGDAFLQSFYTIFDQDNMVLGFAHSINNGSLIIKEKDRRLLQQEISYGSSYFFISSLILMIFIF